MAALAARVEALERGVFQLSQSAPAYQASTSHRIGQSQGAGEPTPVSHHTPPIKSETSHSQSQRSSNNQPRNHSVWAVPAWQPQPASASAASNQLEPPSIRQLAHPAIPVTDFRRMLRPSQKQGREALLFGPIPLVQTRQYPGPVRVEHHPEEMRDYVPQVHTNHSSASGDSIQGNRWQGRCSGCSGGRSGGY